MSPATSTTLSGQIDLSRLADRSGASDYIRELRFIGATVARDETAICAASGEIRWRDNEPGETGEPPAETFLAAWRKHGEEAPAHLAGSYAVVVADAARGTAFLAVDRFAKQTLCYAVDRGILGFSDRADQVPGGGCALDAQAVFDYLYFHMIPASRTIFRDVRRLPACHFLLASVTERREGRYGRVEFHSRQGHEFRKSRERFHELLDKAVAAQVSENGRTGAFLSGGTDSSTVAGVLRRARGERPKTYSIGFEAEGYDEMEYARVAARHFDCDHHEYYVTPADVMAALPKVAKHHDQPFGNSSALPSYFCAQMARADGCAKIIAGDGGDELFGGNTRYALQKFLDHYQSLPAGIRRSIEPFCGDDSPLRKIPGLRQVIGYVRHSRVALPHRFENHNLAMQLGPGNLLHPSLLEQIDFSAPGDLMTAIWNECDDPSVINKMLAYDWRITLADNDLPKVRGAAAMAGIEVGYPLLDDAIVDFSMGLPPDWKVRRYKLRWFFKEALKGFLPDEIIAKKKHGFGLPFGPWMVKTPALKRFARECLDSLVGRQLVNARFVDELFEKRVDQHPGYYGTIAWVLMVLELWLQEHPGSSL